MKISCAYASELQLQSDDANLHNLQGYFGFLRGCLLVDPVSRSSADDCFEGLV